MTISPVYSYPAYSCAAQAPIQAPVSYAPSNVMPVQVQSAVNIGPNAKGEPDLVCNANYDAKTKTLQLSSFERGWFDSNLWHTIKPDGSGETISAWGIASKYPAGTFSTVLNKAQGIYYTQGKISDDSALELVKEVRAAADVARQNGMEVSDPSWSEYHYPGYK